MKPAIVDDVEPPEAAAAIAVVAFSLCVDIIQGCSGLQGYVYIHNYY